jgi:hypothetical protein
MIHKRKENVAFLGYVFVSVMMMYIARIYVFLRWRRLRHGECRCHALWWHGSASSRSSRVRGENTSKCTQRRRCRQCPFSVASLMRAVLQQPIVPVQRHCRCLQRGELCFARVLLPVTDLPSRTANVMNLYRGGVVRLNRYRAIN